MYSIYMPFSIHRTGDQTYYGSGSFVVDAPHYILLTCCHNFLTEKETEELQIMTPASLKEKLTANCKKATYEISDPTTFQTTAKAASDVLLDFDNPRLYIVQVYMGSSVMYLENSSRGEGGTDVRRIKGGGGNTVLT